MKKINAGFLVFAMVFGLSVLSVNHVWAQDQPEDPAAEAQVMIRVRRV